MRAGPTILAALAALVAVAGSGCDRAHPESPAGPQPVLVAAASSLREVLLDTKPLFEASHPGVTLQFSFDASSTLARQIREGARFDVFLSADAETMARVKDEIDSATVAPFLGNRLALVARSGLERPASSPAALAGSSGTIALAGPEVPAGRYARAWLEKNGLLAGLSPRIANAASVRAALGLVESGAADHAFVYATEAGAAKTARLVWTADAGDEAASIVYVAGVLAKSGAPARAYAQWIAGTGFSDRAAAMGFHRLSR
jgi:molybdate transport system substrate-binding protein